MSKNEPNTFEEITGFILQNYDEIENHIKQHPEQEEKYLAEIQQTMKNLLNHKQLFTGLILGIPDYHKRAKKRAARKPLSINSARRLMEELNQIAKLLKIWGELSITSTRAKPHEL